MKRLVQILVCATLFMCAERWCHKQTRGFQTVKIRSHLVPQDAWDLRQRPALEIAKVHHLLSMPFHFLGSGGQCYAFLSQDGKTVLKVYKMHHLRSVFPDLPPWGGLALWRAKQLYTKRAQAERLFASARLAWEELREETGLLHVQLNPDKEAAFRVHITDRLGISHDLALDDVPFALQVYAENPFLQLRRDLASGDLTHAKQVITQITDTLKARYQKNIADSDPALRRNMGLHGDRAIFIDIGAFGPMREGLNAQEQLYKETRRMARWLAKRSPELHAYLEEKGRGSYGDVR